MRPQVGLPVFQADFFPDVVAVDFYGSGGRMEELRHFLRRTPFLDEIDHLTRKTLKDLRRLSNHLRPLILEDMGLIPALKVLCNEFSEEFPGISINFKMTGEKYSIRPEVETSIYRIVQESLNNIRKHAASAQNVDLLVEFLPGSLIVAIKDDGPGFFVPDQKILIQEGHLGLVGMYERSSLMNGRLSIESVPGKGTQISLVIPN